MNRLSKAGALFVFVLAVILNSALIYADDLGCCTNPNAGAFLCLSGSKVFKNAECCPTPESSYPAYYSTSGGAGPVDYNACVANFFHTGKNCNEVANCKLGCCCGPSTATVKSKEACSGTGFTFHEGTTDCTSACAVSECGDGKDNDNNGCMDYPGDSGCESSADGQESGGQCLYDCSSVTYEPKLKNLDISPVKGEKKLKLKWSDECYMNSIYYEVYRCKGSCNSFTLIGTSLSGVREFVDDSDELLFSQDYKYQVKAYYTVQATTPTIEGTGNLGDLECWHKKDSAKFCIHSNYYNQYKAYLVSKLGFSEEGGEEDIEGQFESRFNSAYSCSSANKLTTGSQCSNSTICVVSGSQAKCLEEPKCNYAAANPFGLYYEKTTCESGKYCFYDKSFTVADNCFACSPKMGCYDYKSKGSCVSDNCGVGSCAWNYLSEELGTGVCVSTVGDNCKWCNKEGTSGVESNKAMNNFFEVCTKEKAQKLSVEGNKCYYKDGKAKSCREVICTDYDKSECSTVQIQLDSSNKIINSKADTCGIGVCQRFGSTCRKNADGNNEADCDGEDCEKDYFKPDTIITPVIEKGIYKGLVIHISDKTSNSGAATSKTGKGYATYLCKGCTGGHPFDKAANSSKLTISNLNLFDSTSGELMLTFAEGTNSLRYYSEDPSKNVGIVKTIDVKTYSNATGPIVRSVEVDGANKLGSTQYTNNARPKILVKFYEKASITRAKLISSNKQVATPTYSTDFLKEVVFYFSSNLASGNYTLEFEAKNEKDIYMDKPYLTKIVIDLKAPTLVIRPTDGELVKEEEVNVNLTFDEEVNLLSVNVDGGDVLGEFISDNASQGNKVFEAKIKLGDGTRAIEVKAADYANNQVYGVSKFVVNAKPLNITLKEPSYGVAGAYTFDVVVLTDNDANCRYSFNDPLEYDFMTIFDSTGSVEHKINDFNQIPDGSTAEQFLYVKCNDPVQGLGAKTFKLKVDTTPPVIEAAYAYPNPVIENPPTTSLKVQTDELVICRYSKSTPNYLQMEGKFSSIGEDFKTIHEQKNITLPGGGSYTYYMGCRNLAELDSGIKTIDILVDFNIPLNITDHTPGFFPSSPAYLAVETNKKAQCKYSTDSSVDSGNLFGPSGYVHVKALELSAGRYIYYVKCKDDIGWSNIVQIKFSIDSTSPEMRYVNDTSTLLSHPEFTCQMDRLRVKWLGEDLQSGVKSYTYSLLNAGGLAIIDNTTSYWESNSGSGDEWLWVNNLALQNNTGYYFEVGAENYVGLVGEAGTSDGVAVNTAVCQYCSASKDDCCFIEEGDGICDPDCDEPDGFPVDTDCADCTPAEGDCCDVSNGNGCDEDCPPGADPDCGYISCDVDNECDTANNKWCNNGWWDSENYCSQNLCGMEDYDCGYVCPDDGKCDVVNKKWCSGGEWNGQDYCGHCGYYDSTCGNCEQATCDTANNKWCSDNFWTLNNYCSNCDNKDYTCNDGCTSCDTTNKKFCDGSQWATEKYCDSCSSLDSDCSYTCTENQCDTISKQWCSNGRWNSTNYCEHCSWTDYNCGNDCTDGSCDAGNNFYCSNNAWQAAFTTYCSQCGDSTCSGSCTQNSCDVEQNKWCNNGLWQSDEYCENCGTIDKDCASSCISGTCDITNNKWCSYGYWEGSGQTNDDYCVKCYLYDSDCARTCTDGSCDVPQKRYCDSGEWISGGYCNYCGNKDSTCEGGCDSGNCDVTNKKWCDGGTWKETSYCSNCADEDSTCSACTDNSCDKDSKKWCEEGKWKSGTNSQYCSHCGQEDSSCPVCENNVCDTGNKKWCDGGSWSVVDYCNNCGGEDASCNEDCDSNTCDVDNKEWCDGGEWNDANYCAHCGEEDASCIFDCSSGTCDTTNKFWCNDGKWNNSDYCSNCGSKDYSCGASCTNGECDKKVNKWCEGGSWTQLGYCDHCDDSDCTGTCSNSACDTISNKWCSNGEWTNVDYCEHCGNKDWNCYYTCEEETCDTNANKRCSGGLWVNTNTYCDYCSLKDSDCTIVCAEGECDASYKKTCKNSEWTNESYCDYCSDYDSSCAADCTNTKDGCCTGTAEGTCDPDCTESSDTDCEDCTASQGDCCYPTNDAICDLDCPSGIDPDCADNSCQNSGSCQVGESCTDSSNCDSRFCYNNKCTQAACDDDIENGEESDVDCGGSCVKCDDDEDCNIDSDCKSNYCGFGTCNSDTCFDGQLSGSETDVDCGGACPTKCDEGNYCEEDDDCISGTECYLGKCAVCGSENDYCGTEGSGDSDGDGMPDEWELRYGFDPNDPSDALGDADGGDLTNLEEYTHSTDPNNIDSDGDGYSDKEEIDAGTDPLDPDDKPKSKIWIILLMLLGGVLVGGVGFVVYHQISTKKEETKPLGPPTTFQRRPSMPMAPRVPVRGGITPEQLRKIRELRKKREEELGKKRKRAFEAFGEKKSEEGKEKITTTTAKEPEAVVKKAKKRRRRRPKQDVFVRLSKEVAKAKKKEGKPAKGRVPRAVKNLKKSVKKKK